jgi:hypothetical protein
MRKFFFFRREWLNAPGSGTAFVEAQIDKPNRTDSLAWYEGGNLVIKDCNKQVTLGFPVSNVASRENSLRKIAVLFEVLEQFQTNLLHVADLAEKAELARAKRKDVLGDDVCDCTACSLAATRGPNV